MRGTSRIRSHLILGFSHVKSIYFAAQYARIPSTLRMVDSIENSRETGEKTDFKRLRTRVASAENPPTFARSSCGIEYTKRNSNRFDLMPRVEYMDELAELAALIVTRPLTMECKVIFTRI